MNKNSKTFKPQWLTADNRFYSVFKDERKKLKENMTPAETKLWEYLRNKKLGVKFRRQHIIDIYIPDFVALSINLIVEVDGKIHLKRKKKDDERTRWLELMGYKVIRFTNEEIEHDIEGVIDRIKLIINELTPPTSPKGRLRSLRGTVAKIIKANTTNNK